MFSCMDEGLFKPKELKEAWLHSFQCISVESFLIKYGFRGKTLRWGKVILEIIHPG